MHTKKPNTKSNRLHLVVATALVGLLATVAYAATISRTYGPHDWINGAHRIYKAGAGRTFSIDPGADDTTLTIKSETGGKDAKIISDADGTKSIADYFIAGETVYENYDGDTALIREAVTETLTSGAASGSFAAGSQIAYCLPAGYVGAARSYSINIGWTNGTRTYAIQLGQGGTTNDTVKIVCWVQEPLG